MFTIFYENYVHNLHFDSTERVGISLFQATVSDECLTMLSFHTGII